MDGSNSQGNSNQNKPQGGTNANQKPGLSWNQPTGSVTQKNTPKTTLPPPEDSTGRVLGIVVGIIIVFALAAWGIVALHKRSASNELSNATSTDSSLTDSATTSDENTTDSSDTNPTPAPEPVSSVTPTTVPTAPVNPKTTPTSSPEPTESAAAGSASFAVASTQPAGSSVAFSNLSIAQPTWLIVYDNVEGKTGSILGAELFFKGDTAGTISLLRSTEAGKKYYVGAAVDNGKRSFSRADEKIVPDQNGNQMLSSFTAQ